MSEAPNAGMEPWITQLDEDISGYDDEMCEYDFAMIMKEFLLSDGKADIAR